MAEVDRSGGERPPTVVIGSDGTAAPAGLKLVLGAMALAILLTIAYWVIWFLVDRDLLASSHAAAYYTFENAFPLADGWLVLTLALGVAGLARQRPWGLLFALLAGGAGIYLGCMDVLFDLENGIYALRPGHDASGPLIEIGINLLTFTLGVSITAWVWHHRRLVLR
jgi:hypothetical protein